MTIRARPIYVGNDNLIRLVGLWDEAEGTFINDATVTFDIRTDFAPGGTSITSGSLTYVSGSDGEYQGTIEDGASLTVDADYCEEILATASGDRVGRWQTIRKAVRRGA